MPMIQRSLLVAKEVFAVATTNYKKEMLFQISYRADITTAHIIRFHGVQYEITRLDTFEDYKENLTLYCKRK